MNEPLLLAYLAGVMDADGYFCFRRTPARFRPDGTLMATARYSELVGLNQITDQVIAILKGRYGGNVMHYAARTLGSRPIYRWRIGDRKACVAVRELLPYLRIKRRDAEILLEMRADKDRPRTETRTPNGQTFDFPHWTGKIVQMPAMGLSPEVVARRETLYQEMRALHDTKSRQHMLFTVR